MSFLTKAERRKLARELLESEVWDKIIVPHIRQTLQDSTNALKYQDLKKKKAAMHRGIILALEQLKGLPETIIGDKPEEEEFE